jgi:tetratricopeptide (TPR) repeat protein
MRATSRRLYALAASSVILVAVPSLATGQAIPGYPESILEFDPREVSRLPPYCIHTAHFRENVPGGMDREKSQPWITTLGDVFQTLHHYCWALMYLHRAKVLAQDERTRRWNYSQAIHDIDYVLNYINAHGRHDFVLLPEILTRKGEALVGLGRGPRALVEFERAIQLKPDYWPPYAHVSDYYKGIGEMSKAREALESGLTHSPQANGLQRRLRELDAEIAKRGTKSTKPR